MKVVTPPPHSDGYRAGAGCLGPGWVGGSKETESMSSTSEDRAMATIVVAIVLGVVALAFLIGITTHRSHLADLKYAHEEMQSCIQSDRSAADCRLIVYGSR